MSYKFHYNELDDLMEEAQKSAINLPICDNFDILFSKVNFGKFKMQNRFVIQPMEGCDGKSDGSPGELTLRRYNRFAKSGAALIWAEACSVTEEGKANPRQLFLTEKNILSYKEMIRMIKKTAKDANGENFSPLIFLQLTHSGRYSRPNGYPQPIIASNTPLDSSSGVNSKTEIVSDDYLKSLPEKFASSAKLAALAGFDGVDIKSCHRYLFSELLSSFTRVNSIYGGFDMENRQRLILETISAVSNSVGDNIEITSRLNFFDGMSMPFGFGGNVDGQELNLSEPLKLIEEMTKKGIRGINVTLGNPYYSPHLNRPYDRPVKNGYEPPETQLKGIERFIFAANAAQNKFKDLNVVLSGMSWLRQFFPYIASGALKDGAATSVGLGRLSFAYPEFIHDLREKGELDKKKICITCSLCSQLMRNGEKAGCAVKDGEYYSCKV